MRGEDAVVRRCMTGLAETPPHAWGRLFWCRTGGICQRNTPTCVGKTYMPKVDSTKMVKHPHMRGEDASLLIPSLLSSETPPHAWGRLGQAAAAIKVIGNTPTCVGKTKTLKNADLSDEKHPHMRGEDTSTSETDAASSETPPHAWGRPILYRN